MKLRNILAVAALAVSPATWAVPTSAVGPGFAIPDNDPGGASSQANVTDDLLINTLSVRINGLTGTWVGDLVVTLTAPGGGTSADLMFRTGQLGGVGAGDSSDLGGDYEFADGGADWWAAAGAAGGTDIIPPGVYEATTADGVVVSLDGVFGGSSSLGLWTLTASDQAGGDIHTFAMGDWVINIDGDPNTSVPEPGLLTLLGLGLVGLGLRRRRT